MIFNFLKDKVLDKKEELHDGWLGSSILDRFLRLVGVVIVLGLAILALTKGISFSPAGLDIAKWLLPLIIIFLILDILFFHIVTPWIWKGIVMLFGFLWEIINTVISMAGTVIGEIISFLIDIISSVLTALLGGKK
jgi:hypothetical protein